MLLHIRGGVLAPQDKSSAYRPPSLKEKQMDYTERLQKLDKHIAEHPTDYQAVIARLKTRSDAIEHQMYLKKIERLKRVAEFRRRYEQKF